MRASIQRLLTLRQFPGLIDADLDELAVIAENVVEISHPARSIAAPAGRVPALQLVVEGRLESGTQSYGPRSVFGGLASLAGRPLVAPAIAVLPTRTLQLGAADLANILEDNYGLLSNLRRAMARRLLAVNPRAHVRQRLPYAVRAESLGLVDRLILLRRQITFATGRIQPLAALARATRELTLAPGEPLVRAGAPATSSLVIIDGTVRVRGTDACILGPNDTLGVVESLAETAYAITAEAVTAVRVLECPSVALFDVIEDHTDLALSLIARLAGEVLDAGESDASFAQAS